MSRILIVEDERCLAEAIAALLADEGYEVALAANGRDALASMRSSRPDLVLTDYMMPVMDGGELVRAIRRDEALRQLPIVMMSAAPFVNGVARDHDVALLHKPFDVDLLLRELRRLHS